MLNRDIHLICGIHVQEVESFLSRFFERRQGIDNQSDEIIFVTPDRYFQIILRKGFDLGLTQGVTFEILSESMEQLNKFSKNNKTNIKKFLVEKTERSYFCHFAEALGPHNICRVRMNYCQRPGR